MGIEGLLGFLKSITKDCNIEEYRGKCLGIDASVYLYKASYSCATELGLELPTKEYLNYILSLVSLLRDHNIKPVIVFDGNKLPAKIHVNSNRQRSREESLTKAKELWASGKKEDATSFFQKALKVQFNMVQTLIENLRNMGVEYVVAPYEADAQLVYLESEGMIDGVITEDSDLLAFGCKEVLYKLDVTGRCKVIRREDLHKCMNLRNFKFEYFRYMCIITGCDYLPNIPGVGIKTAHTFVQKFAKSKLTIEGALPQIGLLLGVKTITVPKDYVEKFLNANKVFMHQSVFNTKNQVEVPMMDYQETDGIYDKEDFRLYAENITDLCLGNINIETGAKVNNYLLESVQGPGSIWGTSLEERTRQEDKLGGTSSSQLQGIQSSLNLHIVERLEEIDWTVPCFPVLDIEFTKIVFECKGELYHGLLKREDMPKFPNLPSADIICWSSCSIEIDNLTYLVIWKWDMQVEVPSKEMEPEEGASSDISHVSETDLSDEASTGSKGSENEESDDDNKIPCITHTLPFKVMGVAHTTKNQDHMELAFKKRYQDRDSVTAHIMPEPDNERDSNAICVKLDYGNGPMRVGYIPRELTKYIHPLLKSNKIIKTRVGKIKYITHWYRFGFYMSLLITRNGEWEQFVQNAARHVKLY